MTEPTAPPTDQEVAAALDLGRRLDHEADLGWPGGYDAPAVKAQVRSVLDTIERAIAAAPPEGRAILGREFAASLLQQMPVYRPGVAPKKRGAGRGA